jgi:ketosteroid isomerase-like protein
MDIEANRKIAIDLMTSMSKGDVERAETLLAEDATWWVLGSGYMERSALLDASRFMSSAPRAQFEIVATTAEKDRVAMEAKGDFLFADGKEYKNTYHFLFIVRNGKVVEGKEYLDTALVERVFGKTEAQA